MKKCPFCAEDIQDKAIFCKHCRRDLPASQQATTHAGEDDGGGSGKYDHLLRVLSSALEQGRLKSESGAQPQAPALAARGESRSY